MPVYISSDPIDQKSRRHLIVDLKLAIASNQFPVLYCHHVGLPILRQ